jgi:PAS domain S-box-containing protein
LSDPGPAINEAAFGTAASNAGHDLLDRVFDSAAVGLMISDRNGTILRVNRALADMLGYPPEELLGRPIFTALTGDDADAARQRLAARLQGHASPLRDWNVQRKDGAPRVLRATATPIRSDEGGPLFVSVCYDVTEQREAERAVLETGQRLNSVLGSITEGYVALDGEFRFVEINPAALRMAFEGRRVEDLIGRRFWDLYPEGAASEFHEQYRRAMADGVPVHFEARSVLSGRWFETHAYPRDGRLEIYIRDITARKEAEEALAASEREYRAIFELSASGKAQADPATGRFLRVNRRFCEITGYPEAELLRMTFHDLTHPDDLQSTLEIVGPVLRGEASEWQSEKRYVRKDGSVVWVTVTGSTVRDESGTPVRAIATVQDVTKRKQAEQAARQALASLREANDSLRESEGRLARAQRIARVGDWELDWTTKEVRWSDEMYPLMGVSPQTFRPSVETFLAAVPAEDYAVLQQALDEAMAACTPYNVDHRVVWPDGTVRVMNQQAEIVRDEGGGPLRLVGTMLDVTDRKRDELALRHAKGDAEAARAVAEAANKAKDQFLAVLSHELRTPLTPVVMTLAGLELDRSLSQDVRDDLTMIRRNVELETKLIDDLLDVTRITNGKLRLHPQPTDMHALVETVTDLFHSELRGKRIELACDLNARDPRVCGDPARLQQVLWNLVKNAIKFTPEGGRIVVRTANPDARLLAVSVTDTGVGIDSEAVPRIFNAFEQADQSVARQFGGLGLGLAISRALVELHGGAIRVESAGRGRGATFVVELPTVGSIERLVNQIQRPPHPASHGGPHSVRVLLVEDHPDTLRVLKRLLEKMGYAVLPATSAAAALNVLATQPVDVLVSDIGLPDATGHDLMRKIRADHGVLPGIAISGFGMDADVRNSHAAGFLSHMTKPVDVRHLDAAIRTALKDGVAARGAPAET